MRCPKCGVEYPIESDRCINCGNPRSDKVENSNSTTKANEVNLLEFGNSYLLAKLLGITGIMFFLPLAIASGIYLLTREEKDAKYWGLAFLIVGCVMLASGVFLIYTMGYDKFMATYNFTNYSNNFTNFGLK